MFMFISGVEMFYKSIFMFYESVYITSSKTNSYFSSKNDLKYKVIELNVFHIVWNQENIK